MPSSGKSTKLELQIPFELSAGVKIPINQPFRFRVWLAAGQLHECALTIDAEPGGVFAETPYTERVTFTKPNEQVQVELCLTPTAYTDAPLWVSVQARANDLVQQGGFFVNVI